MQLSARRRRRTIQIRSEAFQGLALVPRGLHKILLWHFHLVNSRFNDNNRIFPRSSGNPLQQPCFRNVTTPLLSGGCRWSGRDDARQLRPCRPSAEQEPMLSFGLPGSADTRPEGNVQSLLSCPKHSGAAALKGEHGFMGICHLYRLKERSRRFAFP